MTEEVIASSVFFPHFFFFTSLLISCVFTFSSYKDISQKKICRFQSDEVKNCFFKLLQNMVESFFKLLQNMVESFLSRFKTKSVFPTATMYLDLRKSDVGCLLKRFALR